MREINLLAIHCSASDIKAHDDISVIREWHLARGWSDVGYSHFIKKDGTIQLGRPIHIQGAHIRGHNANSIGICLSGRDDFTMDQCESLENLLLNFMHIFNLTVDNIKGHYELDSNKTCPNFYVEGLREKLRGIST